VFDLDQYLLRATHRSLRRLGDRHVKQICRELAGFDAVNLQLEHGTLGRLPADIHRRFCWIVSAAPQISVTFHTVQRPPEFEFSAWLNAILRLRLTAAVRLKSQYARNHLLSVGIIRHLRRAQRLKPVTVIVHTRRDLRQMKYVHKIKRVYDHPLSFLNPEQAQTIRATASRAGFPLLDAVPAEAKLIGVFGFLGRYKGFETVVKAMQHLPAEYHLLVFGGVHPREIRGQQPIDPYLASLLDAAYVDTNLFDRLRAGPGETAPGLSLSMDGPLQHLLINHPKDLSGRVHFMGALDDDHFLAGMAICDVVVMPYLEVGQSASGPMSQSLELGCRTIASRNQTFLQLSRYHKDRIEFFEIGNHLELAERIMAPPQYAAERLLAFNTETNKAVYVAANSRRRWPRRLLRAARWPFASSRGSAPAGSVASTGAAATAPPP
jgi:glycosyltransferase involved in cell wall biosynthesis